MNIFLNLLFPPCCGICGKLEDLKSNRFICDTCLEKLESYKLHKKIDKETYSIFRYESIIRNLILEYKFMDKSYLYRTFSSCILFDKKVCNFIKSYDIISPVPLSYRRFFERGYNQTTLICKEVARNIGIAYLETLKKIKNIKPQPTKSLKDRVEDVKGVYVLKNNIYIKKRKVLIFDDILTTGATSSECKKALLKGGATSVGVLTLAHGIDDKYNQT